MQVWRYRTRKSTYGENQTVEMHHTLYLTCMQKWEFCPTCKPGFCQHVLTCQQREVPILTSTRLCCLLSPAEIKIQLDFSQSTGGIRRLVFISIIRCCLLLHDRLCYSYYLFIMIFNNDKLKKTEVELCLNRW